MLDSTDWDSLPKPWTIKQCCDRYVMGDRIALRTLAELSGVPHSTIAHNCSSDKWIGKRSKIREAVDFQTIDIISAQISGHQARILNGHYQSEVGVFDQANAIVSIVSSQLEGMKARFQESQDNGEKPKNSVYELQALVSSLNQAQNTIAGAINGQRKALGLDYEDLNYAVASVRRSGYEVVGRSDFEAFKEYLENLSKNQDSEFSGNAVQVTTL